MVVKAGAAFAWMFTLSLLLKKASICNVMKRKHAIVTSAFVQLCPGNVCLIYKDGRPRGSMEKLCQDFIVNTSIQNITFPKYSDESQSCTV